MDTAIKIRGISQNNSDSGTTQLAQRVFLKFIQPLSQLSNRLHSRAAANLLTTPEQNNGRDGTYCIMEAHCRGRLCIHTGELRTFRQLFSRSHEDRQHLLAGRTPVSPEVDQQWFICRTNKLCEGILVKLSNSHNKRQSMRISEQVVQPCRQVGMIRKVLQPAA